ncbi:MAG TPA: PIN domain-containing protein [Acidobacteriaceae bacterium]
MGVIVDSSVIIRAERAREYPTVLIRRILSTVGPQEIALSTVGLTELVHGTYRGSTNAARILSRAFLDEILSSLPVYDYTPEAAEIAGRIDAEERIKGFHIPFADLLIGATALSLNFAILTSNERHFRLIPGLTVIPF